MSDFVFEDGKGRKWDLKINLTDARRLDDSDFDAIRKGSRSKKWSFITPDKQIFADMMSDTSFMFAVIWALVFPQAKAMFVRGSFLFGDWLPPEYEAPPDVDLEGWKSKWIKEHSKDRAAAVSSAFSQENYDLAEMEFAGALNGDAVNSGRLAFWRSLADFFQDQKTVLSVLMRRYEAMRATVDLQIEEVEPEIEKALAQSLEKDMQELRQQLSLIASGDSEGLPQPT